MEFCRKAPAAMIPSEADTMESGMIALMAQVWADLIDLRDGCSYGLYGGVVSMTFVVLMWGHVKSLLKWTLQWPMWGCLDGYEVNAPKILAGKVSTALEKDAWLARSVWWLSESARKLPISCRSFCSGRWKFYSSLHEARLYQEWNNART